MERQRTKDEQVGGIDRRKDKPKKRETEVKTEGRIDRRKNRQK